MLIHVSHTIGCVQHIDRVGLELGRHIRKGIDGAIQVQVGGFNEPPLTSGDNPENNNHGSNEANAVHRQILLFGTA